MTKRKAREDEDEHDVEEAEILEEIKEAQRSATTTDTALGDLIKAIHGLARAQMLAARRIEITMLSLQIDRDIAAADEAGIQRMTDDLKRKAG